ncbi:MAG TPA: exodeoxyribonuclease III [Saprospiraceae bacterium]|nr:exodeoxyribonuclease III [Saprospiraceae bacterium]
MTKIITWNVNGIRAVAGKNLYQFIDDVDADILCFNETKATEDQVKDVLSAKPKYHVYANSATKKGYSGVAIASKVAPISVWNGIGIEEHDDEGRIITAEFENFILICGYIPNAGDGLKRLTYRSEWDKALLDYINTQRAKGKGVIVTGDFNVAHKAIDLARPKENYNKTAGYTQVEIDGMDAFVGSGLIDTYRHFQGDRVQYTFWSVRFGARPKNLGWRIDYFLVSPDFIQNIHNSEILDQVMGSDHCPILLEIK